MDFTVTQYGKELEKSKYTFDEETKTFSSKENNLVLDFSKIKWITFKTASDCTFKTSSDCTFDTGFNCVVVRRDIYEVIELEEGKKIKLNWYGKKWFTYKKEETTELTQEEIKKLRALIN